jgi:hypothetical protein
MPLTTGNASIMFASSIPVVTPPALPGTIADCSCLVCTAKRAEDRAQKAERSAQFAHDRYSVQCKAAAAAIRARQEAERRADESRALAVESAELVIEMYLAGEQLATSAAECIQEAREDALSQREQREAAETERDEAIDYGTRAIEARNRMAEALADERRERAQAAEQRRQRAENQAHDQAANAGAIVLLFDHAPADLSMGEARRRAAAIADLTRRPAGAPLYIGEYGAEAELDSYAAPLRPY